MCTSDGLGPNALKPIISAPASTSDNSHDKTLCVLDWQRLIVVHEKNRVDPFQFKLVAVTGKSKKISFGVAYSHH
jgi:hypothetical protein